MPNPRTVFIDVIIESVTGNSARFRFETTDLPMGPDNVLYFRNCNHAGFRVHYTLRNPPDDYLFPQPSNKDLALASQEGAGCPAQSAGHWDKFWPHSIIQNRTTLVVHNENDQEKQFGYSLFVTNNNGGTYVRLDPGGENQNGPSRLFSWKYVALACLAVAGASALGTAAALVTLT